MEKYEFNTDIIVVFIFMLMQKKFIKILLKC